MNTKHSPLSAPRILLMGPGGTGKTYALRTLVEAGITPCFVALDGVGLESIADLPCPKIHWHVIRAQNKTWASMATEATRMAPMGFEGLAKSADPRKADQKRFIDTLKTFADFTCDRCGEKLGEVDSWGTGRAIVLDHFTELCQAAKEWTVGEKLVLHEGEWQAAQNLTENLVRQLTTVPRCWVVLIAHIDRETDFVQGGSKVTIHALGKKLAPKLPPMFSDVILAQRIVKEFTWATAAVDTDLKSRNLPIETKLAPSFGPIVAKWVSRGGIIE